MKRISVLVFSVVLSTIGLPSAHAQTTSDQMTCKQAVATYERDGRIYVRTPRGTVLPIYKPLPVSQRRDVVCKTVSFQRTRYNVRTKDKRYCTIGYYCS